MSTCTDFTSAKLSTFAQLWWTVTADPRCHFTGKLLFWHRIMSRASNGYGPNLTRVSIKLVFVLSKHRLHDTQFDPGHNDLQSGIVTQIFVHTFDKSMGFWLQSPMFPHSLPISPHKRGISPWSLRPSAFLGVFQSSRWQLSELCSVSGPRQEGIWWAMAMADAYGRTIQSGICTYNLYVHILINIFK